MNPALSQMRAQDHVDDLYRQAAAHRLARRASRSARVHRARERAEEVIVRLASVADAETLVQLSQLDSSSPPRGATLVAEVRGEIVAALPLDGGRAIANPFRRTSAALDLLSLRAAQLRDGGDDRGGQPRLLLANPLRRLLRRAAA